MIFNDQKKTLMEEKKKKKRKRNIKITSSISFGPFFGCFKGFFFPPKKKGIKELN
jgi:hypothetical protein